MDEECCLVSEIQRFHNCSGSITPVSSSTGCYFLCGWFKAETTSSCIAYELKWGFWNCSLSQGAHPLFKVVHGLLSRTDSAGPHSGSHAGNVLSSLYADGLPLQSSVSNPSGVVCRTGVDTPVSVYALDRIILLPSPRLCPRRYLFLLMLS